MTRMARRLVFVAAATTLVSALASPAFAVSTTNAAHTRSWLSGRGHYPALRIGREPYGIVVTSAFTLAPLSRRKQAEAHAQSTEVADAAPGEDVARLDPLDAAAAVETGIEGI